MNNLKDFANDTVIKDLALECKQYRELIPRLCDDLAAVKKAHKEALEFNYDLAEENTAIHTKTIAMQERISLLDKVAEAAQLHYWYRTTDDNRKLTIDEENIGAALRAAGYLKEQVE